MTAEKAFDWKPRVWIYGHFVRNIASCRCSQSFSERSGGIVNISSVILDMA